MTLITLIGIAVTTLLDRPVGRVCPSLSANKAARFLAESDQPAAPALPGWRGWLSRLDRPTARWAPGQLLRRARADLYFAQLAGKWTGLGCGPVHLPAGGRLALGALDPGSAGLRQPGPSA